MCLLQLQHRHSLDLEWKWKSFWTNGACRCIQCGHVFTSWLGWNTVETVGVAPSQTVVPCTVYCNTLISILSLQGFQLPTFHAGWCSSAVIFLSLRGFNCQPFVLVGAVIFFLSPRGFQLPTFCAGWWSSAVIFFLSPQGFQLPFFHAHIHGYFSAVR